MATYYTRLLLCAATLQFAFTTKSLHAQQLLDGNYVITLADGGKALDADAPDINNNDCKVHLWDNNGGVTQVWTVRRLNASSYCITLAASGKALDADGPGMYSDGGKVHLWDKRQDGFKTQTWRITAAANNTYTIVLTDGGKSLDAAISSRYQNDGLVHMWSYNGGVTQKWQFTLPAAAIMDPGDAKNAPLASATEINDFNKIKLKQLGVGILGGDNARAFYYHNNQPGETVYKYKKLIDPARLPGEFFNWVKGELLNLGTPGLPLVAAAILLQDIAGYVSDVKDWIFGSSSTKMLMDCWYPTSEFKATICGTMKEASICTQDYLHTQVTQDKDVNIDVYPSDEFKPMLNNRYLGSTESWVECEVKLKNLMNYNTSTNKSTETLTPHNPLMNPQTMIIKPNENICISGPWVADILDLNAKAPIPFTDEKIELVNILLRTNNEIHPINQVWYRKGDETEMIATADATGYFNKTGNGEIEASGINQRMRFYYAFEFPANPIRRVGVSNILEFNVDGVGFDFTNTPASDIQPATVTLKYNGADRVKVNDNSLVRTQKTHRVFFDNVRTRSDGSVQGYIVVETEPIVNQGGSINITLKQVNNNNGGIKVITTRPVNRQ